MSSVVETPIARFWLEDGIIRCVVSAGPDQTRQDAEDSMRVFRQVGGGKLRPVIIDITARRGIGREARAVYGSRLSLEIFTAVALVGSSAFMRAIYNFIVKVNKPPVPTQMFDSLEQAMAWVAQHPGES